MAKAKPLRELDFEQKNTLIDIGHPKHLNILEKQAREEMDRDPFLNRNYYNRRLLRRINRTREGL